MSTRSRKPSAEEEASALASQQNVCPCKPCLVDAPPSKRRPTDELEDRWVQCEHCDVWFHWACVREDDSKDLDSVDTWFCDDCLEQASTSAHPLKIIYKQRKSTRSTVKTLNYANLDQGLEADPNRWANVLRSKPILASPFRKMKGPEVNADWLLNDPTAMTEPVIIEEKKGLGMRVPDPSITVGDVAAAVGPDMPVEVIDVASQSDLANWTLDAWARYYLDKDRSKVRNVISLEVSATELGATIQPPSVVAELDWVDKFWPQDQRAPWEYPKVQKYCLMSVAKCWTDWHVDFAASSVWYHILRGSKTFYFIRPTPSNLAAYERWSGSSDRQENTWLGDEVDAVYEVKLKQGNTMIIPTGWIHAVYTPTDSLVFGGNFLHSLNIGTQLELHRIEIATKVPKKFRFPMFITLLWHVTRYYHDELAKLGLPETPIPDHKRELPPHLSRRILQGLKALSPKMIEQATKASHPEHKEGVTPEQRKNARANVPWDRVPDPKALAVDFRRLVLAALGETEADQLRMEEEARIRAKEAAAAVVPRKRKAAEEHAQRTKSLNGGSTTRAPVAPADITETEERTEGMRPRPVEAGEEPGPPEPCSIVTKRKETRVSQIVRAGKKVIQVSRTAVNIEEKVIWAQVEPAEEDMRMAEPEASSSPSVSNSEPPVPQSSQLSNLGPSLGAGKVHVVGGQSTGPLLAGSSQDSTTLPPNAPYATPGALEAALARAIGLPGLAGLM